MSGSCCDEGGHQPADADRQLSRTWNRRAGAPIAGRPLLSEAATKEACHDDRAADQPRRMRRRILALGIASWHAQAADDPLPSWNDGPAKQAIVEFVEAVTTAGGADFVPPGGPDRHLRPGRHALGRAAALQPGRCSPSTGCGRWPPSTRSGRTRSRSRRCSTGDREAMARFSEKATGEDHRGHPRRHDQRGEFRQIVEAVAGQGQGIRASSGPTPSSSISRCSR